MPWRFARKPSGRPWMLDPEALADVMAGIVREAVAKAIAPLNARILELEQRAPAPGDPGRDGADGVPGVDGMDGAPGRDGQDGPPGPAGKDGLPGSDGRDGGDGEDGKDGAPGSDGTPGKDGVGAAGAVIDRSGNLLLTMTDGTVRELGQVVGRDGVDGKEGARGLNGADGSAGRDGIDGKDGIDGLGFDDLTVEQDGERGFIIRFQRGEIVKEFAFCLPVVIDRGVFKADEAYEAGDAVSWGGSLWIARRETSARPGEGEDWRLAVKRGRDGRDGKDGERGAQGIEGPAGRDLTQLGADGAKW
ncbi:collagen-like protein [Sphingomonas nostoxanthinifaciens]|uniref:collagen-like protein n=1 Tax=Sphingomonas nostoxanthinifaciens TaxID=2872652 RepID=UPI001CC211CD|nr:collagen-like protein [Sphingomonas nostoxanthinifaciens]UAK23664.1 collagen-like protein [Sphingomonas nostoxanthinifaciens]